MYILAAALLAIAICLIVRLRPVRGLTPISMDVLCEKINEGTVQILDVRDPVDYEKQHLNEAVNIYVGRLPYVSKSELQTGREVVIVSSSMHSVKKAARILLKSGYQVSGLVWLPEKTGPSGGRRNECCA